MIFLSFRKVFQVKMNFLSMFIWFLTDLRLVFMASEYKFAFWKDYFHKIFSEHLFPNGL